MKKFIFGLSCLLFSFFLFAQEQIQPPVQTPPVQTVQPATQPTQAPIVNAPVVKKDSLSFMTQVKHTIMGDVNGVLFVASLFWAMIGICISLLIHAIFRDANSPKTPVKFTWKFLLTDNWKRITLSLLVVITTIIFTKEVLNKDLSTFVALGIGLGLDKIVELLKSKYGILQVSRPVETT